MLSVYDDILFLYLRSGMMVAWRDESRFKELRYVIIRNRGQHVWPDLVPWIDTNPRIK